MPRLGDPVARAAFLGALLALGACGEERGAPGHAPAAEPDAASVGADEVTLFDDTPPAVPEAVLAVQRYFDPEADGWPSEVLALRAQPVLEALVRALLAGEVSEGPEGVRGLLAEGFATTALAPELSAVRAGPIAVQEARSPAGERRGAQALPELAAALAEAAGRPGEVELQVVHVELDEAGAAALELRIRALGSEGSGRVQSNLRWRVGLAAADLAVTSIEVLEHVRVRVERPFFSDWTRHAFAGARDGGPGGGPGHQRWFERELLLGVDDYHERMDVLAGAAILGSHGIAVGDVDGDGLEDVYVCQQGGLPNRLFLQRPDGTAVERSAEAGVDFLDPSRSALIADFDGDGSRDLAIATGADVVLAWGDGSAHFGDLTRLDGPSIEEVFSISAADPDGDGDLDVFACRYVQNGLMGSVPLPYHDARNGATNVYWRNEGGRRFVDATAAAGFDAANDRYSLSALWEDLDGDGDLDLYVTNDFGRNTCYRNAGGRFEEVSAALGLDDRAASMGATCADFDLDGRLDLYVSNMFSAAGLRVVGIAERFMPEHPELHAAYRHHARGNTLLRGLPDGRFEDVTERAGVGPAGWAWGALFADFDDDGFEDLYVPNGFVTGSGPDVSSFYWRRVSGDSPPDATPKASYERAWRAIEHMVLRQGYSWSGGERNALFLNLGDGRFADVSLASGAGFLDDARALARVDWDGDGRLDLLVKNRTAPRLRLLRNELEGPGHFVRVDLVGTRSHADAIGARVTVAAGGRERTKTVYAGEGYLAQSASTLFFGLGEAAAPLGLAVRWPDGSSERFEDLAVDRRYRIVQGAGAPAVVELRKARAADTRPLAADPRGVRRKVLAARLPLGPLELPSYAGERRTVQDLAGAPVLLVFWSAASAACRRDLERLRERRAELDAVGLALVALDVDGPRGRDEARARVEEYGLATGAGFVDAGLDQALSVFAVAVLGHARGEPLPAAWLLDGEGRLLVLYSGGLDLDEILEDARLAGEGGRSLMALSGGRWLRRIRRDFSTLSQVLQGMGRSRLAAFYRELEQR